MCVQFRTWFFWLVRGTAHVCNSIFAVPSEMSLSGCGRDRCIPTSCLDAREGNGSMERIGCIGILIKQVEAAGSLVGGRPTACCLKTPTGSVLRRPQIPCVHLSFMIFVPLNPGRGGRRCDAVGAINAVPDWLKDRLVNSHLRSILQRKSQSWQILEGP